jgi:adenosylmethionine-8-amino-7-oxononanoate aminotransferase
MGEKGNVPFSERGVIVRPVGSRIVISPPLILSAEDCDTIISALSESITEFVANC